MIAVAKSTVGGNSQPQWHDVFLRLLPRIRRQAHIAFRTARADVREELVAQAIANALAAVARLAQLDKLDVAYAVPLARYAIKQVRFGRQLGNRLNANDISSFRALVSRGIELERLDEIDPVSGEWKSLLVEDRKAGPAETAAMRIDFADWLSTLSKRNHNVVVAFVMGDRTKEIACRLTMSEGRVSQLRQELWRSWQTFHDAEPAAM